jgi:2-amino-4-hydroxy-6-hydroxymethyldihydropteridine diphosphokinase
LGLGGNLGDRVQHLIDARQRLSDLPQLKRLRSSSFYLSSPIGYADQPAFINCAVEVTCRCSSDSLLIEMQSIETELGRVRDPANQNAARVIDIDLLLFGNEVKHDPKLLLPHPRISLRLFVLQPLYELNPDLVIPEVGSLKQLIDTGYSEQRFAGQVIHRLGA